MLYALVDLGSNSIRMSIYKYDKVNIIPLINKKEMAGLAGYVSDGKLSQRGIEKAISVLSSFKLILNNFKIKNMHVFATASLRNISNTQQVTDSIKEKLNIKIDVLSGEEEARMDFIGVKYFLNSKEGVLIDIGGGSTEIVVFNNSGIKNLTSLPVGSLNMFVNNVKGMVPEIKEIRKIKKKVNQQLDNLKWDKWDKVQYLNGIGGTVRACFKICSELFYDSKEIEYITPQDVKKVIKLIQNDTLNSYKDIFKIVPERIFTIIPGLIILGEVSKRFSPEKISLSKSGIREGYLVNRILKLNVE